MSKKSAICAVSALIALSAAAVPVHGQKAIGGGQPQSQEPAAVSAPAAASDHADQATSAIPTQLGTAVGTTNGTDGAARAIVVSRELSPRSMFMSADIVVKVVMVGLGFASLVTWTICIAKLIELFLAQRRLRRALKSTAEAQSIADARVALGSTGSVLAALLATALREARLSAGVSSDSGIKERAASSFAEITRAEARRMRIGMGVLATIGATSPFVGLFGTVWGIMNSFIGISKSQTTNLAVVAPGIAEALLATAIGLVAAIPAVIIYNHFARVTKGYLELVGRASGAAGRLLSRDLDRAHGGAVSRAAE